MSKLSVLLPSRNEQFLQRTVDDLFAKSTGDIEVIIVLDGYLPNPPLIFRKNQTIIHKAKVEGLRAGINTAAAAANGDYYLRADAHCLWSEGFDEVLKRDAEPDCVDVMRRYSLNPDTWDRRLDKLHVDYHYLSCPWTNAEFFQMHGVRWDEKTIERADVMIDDQMSMQGSSWFMTAGYFHNFLHGLSEVGYGTYAQEAQEIGMKTWLGGGRLRVNKNAYYAHLHKGQRFGRGYNISRDEVWNGHKYSAHYWTKNKWEGRIHDFDWFVDRFWPLPIKGQNRDDEKFCWPENWRDYYEGKLHYLGEQ
jgi:glycosyltransferase involved in cell wall biosynthesis